MNEIFSNADGTIQFVELEECCGSNFEVNLNGRWVESAVTGIVNLSALSVGTSNETLLLGTAAFAALPGAPTPDFTLPANFISLSGDTISYEQNPGPYHSFMFGPGDLPTDGIQSIQVSYSNTQGSLDTQFTVGTNSPKNLAGASGSVDASPPAPDSDFVRGDCNGDGSNNIADPVALLNFLFPNGAAPTLNCQDACDGNDDGGLNIADAVANLNSLFGNPATPLPAPNTCGPDVGADTLSCTTFALCP